MVTGNFMGEFNNAIFRGDISAVDGSFSGSLTAEAIDAISNLNVYGNTVAITTVSYKDRVSGFNDDSKWRDVSSLNFTVPAQDTDGGWALFAMQFTLADEKGDNDRFPVIYRILLDDEIIYQPPRTTKFGAYYQSVRSFFYEITKRVSVGNHQLVLQFRWDDWPTNMYAVFTDIVMRSDYVRK